ncbi:hypothetical protein [Streptomyces pseudogriseolus]|uniref:hypothetical protein n=1 Tax=Streptomyces pseudogriseolus TaxID=36817 RepID=UPI003FA279A8
MSKPKTVEDLEPGDVIDVGHEDSDPVWVTVLSVDFGDHVETPVIIHTEELAYPLVAQVGQEVEQ